eukprot:6045412-Amphidinium_carterae.2
MRMCAADACVAFFRRTASSLLGAPALPCHPEGPNPTALPHLYDDYNNIVYNKVQGPQRRADLRLPLHSL